MAWKLPVKFLARKFHTVEIALVTEINVEGNHGDVILICNRLWEIAGAV